MEKNKILSFLTMGKVKQKIYAIARVSVESKSLDSTEVRVEGWLPEAGQSNRGRRVEKGWWKHLKLGGSSDKLIHSSTTMDNKVLRSPRAKKDSQSLSLGFVFGFSMCSPGQLWLALDSSHLWLFCPRKTSLPSFPVDQWLRLLYLHSDLNITLCVHASKHRILSHHYPWVFMY